MINAYLIELSKFGISVECNCQNRDMRSYVEVQFIFSNYYKAPCRNNQSHYFYIIQIIMIKKISKAINTHLIHKNYKLFANFVVNNPTTGKPCAQFKQIDGQPQMKAQNLIMDQGRKLWRQLNRSQRKQKIKLFIQAMEKDKEVLIKTLQESTGKHRENAQLQIQASLSVLKQDLNQQYPETIKKQTGQYYFKAFGNILVVCDYRMVALSCVKYIVSCGIAGNSIILNPHRYGLPLAKKIQQIWRTTLVEYPLIYCPINNYADGLQYFVQKKDLGFVSFTGDIEAGNAFYHFMAQKSEILAESEFLLMSSDTAYVMKDLNEDKLRQAAKNLSMACFMGGGNLFNSVKRILVDQQVSERFTQYFLQASNLYRIKSQSSKITPIITSGHIDQANKFIKELKQYKGDQLKLLTQFETKQSYKSLYISPIVYKVDGIASIQYWNKIYPMPICFIENVSSNQTAIQQINSSIFGISSTIYSNDRVKIQQIGQMLDVGVVSGNRWGFAPGIPYSPRKRSGKSHSFSIQSYSNVTKSQSLKGYFE